MPVRLQPLLEHHQDPHQLAVIGRMVGEQVGAQLVDEADADDAAALQRFEARERQFVEGPVASEPDAERQSEAVLRLRQDLRRQEVAQRVLEEPAQLAVP